MGMLDDFDWGKLWNSPSMKMAKEGWNASLPGKVINPMVEGAVSGATYPGDVYSGKEAPPIPSQNPDLSRAADTATMMPMGGLLSATTKQIPAGAIGTFGGPFAKNAPIKDYMAGAKMERKGATPLDIWQERGVFRDPDKNWSHEIPNKGHDFHKELPLKQPFDDRLSNLFRAPELYEAYPALAKTMTTVNPRKRTVYGSFGTMDKRDPGLIRLEGPAHTLRETGIHEIEHAVQRLEKRFGVGERGTKGLSDWQYLTDPAERMARAAQNRRDYTPAQRQKVHPLETPESPDVRAWLKEAAETEAMQRRIATEDLIKAGILKSGERERRWF